MRNKIFKMSVMIILALMVMIFYSDVKAQKTIYTNS